LNRRANHITAFLLTAVIAVMDIQMVRAERMVADLSSHVIEITSQFSGTELLIFGAIERRIPQADGGHGVTIEGVDYDIIVVVQSEPQDMIIRRKELVGPVWANRTARTLKDIQGYYAVASTRPLDVILSAEQLKLLGAGLDQLEIAFDEPVTAAEMAAFREGFIRNMRAKKLYSQQDGTISILDDILFRAILEFPANMPVGDYQVDVYLVRGGEIILAEESPLEVGKAGIERVIYNFAHEYPSFYGVMAVLVALLAGWLGGFLSRKMSA